MKKVIVSLFFFALLINLPLQAEPFNDRSIDYIDRAPIGSSALRPAVAPDIGPFNRRGSDYLSAAPTGSNQPMARVRPEIKGFNDRSRNAQLY
jgi:hypothetical protein